MRRQHDKPLEQRAGGFSAKKTALNPPMRHETEPRSLKAAFAKPEGEGCIDSR